MAPMTKGSNLPYRRLCVELGARITVSEMTLARRLKQKRGGEFALIRRFSEEPCFGVQLATNKADEAAWAASLVEAHGADFVDMNFGCPIDYFTRMGLGAALGQHPNRIRRLVEAMKRSVTKIPVTAKIRLGWNERSLNYLDQARAAIDGGADALFVHGRTRNARYRNAADWDAIARIVAAVHVPVIGNGDLLFAHEIEHARRQSGVAAVMVARAALIKPWIFREATCRRPTCVRRGSRGHLPTVRGAGTGTLGRRRARADARAHIHPMASGLLVPVRSASRGRHVSVDAAARSDHAHALVARGAARTKRRTGVRLPG